jgi:hypothetical protein
MNIKTEHSEEANLISDLMQVSRSLAQWAQEEINYRGATAETIKRRLREAMHYIER